jgi:integrase/recombinase XerC
MSAELTTQRRGGALVIAPDLRAKVRNALDLWLSGFSSENTRNAYRKEIATFTAFAGRNDVTEAVAHFLALEDGQAHAVADAWRADKIARGLSPASVNRSMAALNSLVGSARRHGLTALRLEAKGVKSKSYRDTRGPGVRGIQSMLSVAQDQEPRKAARDAAIIRLAYGLGLRRGEIASLDIGHVDLKGGKLLVLGKGRTEREAMTLSQHVKDALAAWLAFRGDQERDAPLFIGLDRASKGSGRISGAGIYHIVATQLGERSGVTARPHGLRHTAITAALDAFNGDYRKARAFSRHANLDTVRRYDDNRADHAGQVAAALDSILGA